MASAQIMQADLTYNVVMDDGKEYTALVMEDFYSGCFSIDIYDENSDLIDDEDLILEISKMIENDRG